MLSLQVVFDLKYSSVALFSKCIGNLLVDSFFCHRSDIEYVPNMYEDFVRTDIYAGAPIKVLLLKIKLMSIASFEKIALGHSSLYISRTLNPSLSYILCFSSIPPIAARSVWWRKLHSRPT